MKSYINSLGVVLATIGAYLIWRNIAQVNFADKEAFLRGKGILTIPNPTPEDIKKLRLEITLSKLGLGLILIGGLLQMTSNFMP